MLIRILLAGVLLCQGGAAATGQEKRSAEEYELKAAFLLNFARFVEWPETARPKLGTPFRIGIVGKDPSGGTIQSSLSGKVVGGTPIVVETVDRSELALGYQLLFVPSSEKDLEADVLKAVKGRPILTVGEREGFVQAGGLFNFYFEDKKLRVELDNETTRSAGLVVSSKLLRLARLLKSK